jgi:3-deoxy-D-manno-octulosonic-acid transferase
MQIFRDASDNASHAGASIVCQGPGELTQAVRLLIEDPAKRKAMGEAAKAMIQGSLGASSRYAAAIAEEAAKYRV